MSKPSLNTNSLRSVARGGPQSVGRIILILESLTNSTKGTTLSELAINTGAPKTSLVGLLSGLIEEGCLERDETGRYFLGPRFISLAMRTIAGRELIVLARPVLVDLVEALGETAVLGAMATDAELATYLDKVESQNPIRYAVTVGERRDLYCTAVGKVLLAHFEPSRLNQYLKSTRREKFTSTTITSAATLKAEMVRVRQQGIARTINERVMGASGIAAPIFSSDGALVAAVLIAGPTERMRADSEKIERLVERAAAECTRLAGGTPPASLGTPKP